ncbi:unnamed protein product [Hyaloperonospora brassicae]|uniref:Uncharacterized protein n=1 Tax=Hyaloperonospora brassicae TaxID=162125 RepID=A0AAV0V0K3_HYABA|nr:unnamed protein product [Hyaloperonospora brassicae]
MLRVQVNCASQVPVPPPNAAPLEISRETRQQLRATRQRAFERYQENAQWTKELLEDVNKAQESAIGTPSSPTGRAEDLRQQVGVSAESVQQLNEQLEQQNEAQGAAQRRFEEMMTMLKRADDAAAVKECEARIAQEKSLLVPGKPRKMDIVRL